MNLPSFSMNRTLPSFRLSGVRTGTAERTLNYLSFRWLTEIFTISENFGNLEFYTFHYVRQVVYAFWQYELCDVFIEVSKPCFTAAPGSPEAADQRAVRETLWICLDAGLRCSTPRIPFPPPPPAATSLSVTIICDPVLSGVYFF